MKIRSQYVCQQCGYKSPSFLGKCPNCDSWNSLVETIEADKTTSWSKVNRRERKSGAQVLKLNAIKPADFKRITTGIKEADQVLGAGFVPGSVVLLAGDPGIGKSTLALQILSNIGGLYVSGEESPRQIRMRGERLGACSEHLLLLCETNVSVVEVE